MIKKIPIPICGVILGMFGLGNLLQSYSEGIRMTCGVIATILAVLFLISVFTDFGKFKDFSVYFKPWFGAVSQIIWYLAIALHIVMIIYFTKTFILKPDLKIVHASYYIVYVGIAMAAMTAPAYEATGFGMATFWFGFAALLILLVFVTMRYVKLPAPDPAKPLICIYAAPVSLCIAGYIQSAATKSLSFLTVMWVVATVFFLFACVKFVQYLKMPFFPSYAAYTFPFAISAIASKQLMACSVAMEQPMAFLKPIVLIETIIATCTTLYAFVRYLMFLFGSGEKKAA